jgi:hypothetical protein
MEFVLESLPGFIVVPDNADSGFGFGLSVYDFPKETGGNVELVMQVTGKMLPPELGQDFESAWLYLSPYSHSYVNARYLQLCGFRPLMPKETYQY